MAPQQEAGLIGKVGFDELRVPLWAVKMLVDVGEVGPFSNVFFEAYDDPFDFEQSKIRFLPAPWSLAVRNPARRPAAARSARDAPDLGALSESAETRPSSPDSSVTRTRSTT